MSGGNENSHGRLSVAYQRYGGQYDGKGKVINIDNNQQLQAPVQYYKSESDGKHGLISLKVSRSHDITSYYGTGKYVPTDDANGHLALESSVNINDTKVKGIKVDAYELGWRYTGENLRTQIATYYSLSDRSYDINSTDMTIYMKSDKRHIYGMEGAVNYFFDDSDWSVGSNFNLQKSETKVDGKWENGVSNLLVYQKSLRRI